MEGLNSKVNIVDKWLQVENLLEKDKHVVFDFAIFCGRTPKQIADDFSDSSRRQFAHNYGEQLLKYFVQF
jgi:hypothetical protein